MHKHANMLLLMQIVFPEAHWIGTNEENPAEKQLPMPAELQLAVQHENYAFGGAAMQTGELVEFKVWRYLAGNADSEDCGCKHIEPSCLLLVWLYQLVQKTCTLFFDACCMCLGTQPSQTQPDADEEDNDNSDNENDEDEAGPSQVRLHANRRYQSIKVCCNQSATHPPNVRTELSLVLPSSCSDMAIL